MKAIGLFSGGLDSMLAVKLIQEQGIEVDVLHYLIGFESLGIRRVKKKHREEVSFEEIEQQLGVKIQHIDVAREFLQVVLHPKHGYGSAINPCIDCKIFILRKAKEYMDTHKAQFVFTGEVLGQRPMSQHKNMLRHIEKASGLEGYLLRPLSAKLLEPTMPEQQGWIDREKLLDIFGRGRRVQIELAEKYGFRYHQPAGGCLLTDKTFARRLRDVIAHKPEEHITVEDVILLKAGRHFRLSDSVKVIVGRHEVDNHFLQNYLSGRWYVDVREYAGPLALIEGEPTEAQFEQIAQIVVSYTEGKHAERVTVDFSQGSNRKSVSIVPDKNLPLEQWRIQ